MTPAVESAGSRVDRLRLYQFRNYAEEIVEFGPGVNVLSGPNAQGKTNLLEAVATAALSRSPRASTGSDLIQWGALDAQIEMRVVRASGPTEIVLRLRRGDAGAVPRTIAVDGSPRRARALLGVCPVVLFWPEDLLLVKAGPDGRRRLLDVLLAQMDPRAAAELVRYRRILDQRNALLRRQRLEHGSEEALGGFTADLARTGGRIRVARRQLVRALNPIAAASLAELSGGSERLHLSYVGGHTDIEGSRVDDIGGADAESAEVEAERLMSELTARREEERVRGVTVAGPHRDDVEIMLNGRPARSAGSQGQQRTIVLALKLAEVRQLAATAGAAPVLILDDVLSELDVDRRRQLLRALGAGRGAQALLSTTDVGELSGDLGLGDVRHLTVADGHVTHAGDGWNRPTSMATADSG